MSWYNASTNFPVKSNHSLRLFLVELASDRFMTPSFFTFARRGWTPLAVFRELQENSGARRRLVFIYLILHPFPNCCEGFNPVSCKVRSPREVKWPHYAENLNRATTTMFEWTLWNFWIIIRPSVPTKRISHIFCRYLCIFVGIFCRYICRSYCKIQCRYFVVRQRELRPSTTRIVQNIEHLDGRQLFPEWLVFVVTSCSEVADPSAQDYFTRQLAFETGSTAGGRLQTVSVPGCSGKFTH